MRLQYDNWLPSGGYVTADNALNTDKWYHLAVTRNANLVKFYVDGQLVKEGVGESRDSKATIDNTLIGVRYYSDRVQSNYSFQGNIDELRIYNEALTANEMSTLYNATK